MKKLTITLSLFAVVGCVLLAGCSKSKDAIAQSENSPANNPAAAASGDSVEMKIKWPIGEKYAMRMELDQATETKVPNQPQPIKQQVNMAQDYTIGAIKELGNGGRQLELEFKNQTMDVNYGGNKVLSFDSTQRPALDSTNAVIPLLRKMIGGRVRYVTDAAGQVEKLEGIEELMTRIAFNRKSQEHAMFKQVVSEDTLKHYGALGEAMPNRQVKIGESWTVKKNVPTESVGQLAVDMKYTFKNWEQRDGRKCAHIEVTGEMESAAGRAGTTPAVKIENGKMSGDIWFDPEIGMTVAQNFNQDMTLKVMAGAQTITPQLNQKMRLTLVEVVSKR